MIIALPEFSQALILKLTIYVFLLIQNISEKFISNLHHPYPIKYHSNHISNNPSFGPMFPSDLYGCHPVHGFRPTSLCAQKRVWCMLLLMLE